MASQSNVTLWSTAKSTHQQNGRVIIWRLAHEFRTDFDPATQPYRVILVWKYESETGQPMFDEHQRMNTLEDSLGPTLYEGEFATLALVSTGENLREWIYYTRSDNEFMDRLNQALAGEVFPLEIHTALDPTWENYEAFIKGLKVQKAN